MPHSLARHVFTWSAFALMVFACGLVGTAVANPPTTPSPTWVVGGLEPEVYALARSDHGSLYLGGTFDYVGPQTGGGATVSDQGTLLDAGLVDGTVAAAAPDGSGGWYIGGLFARVRGTDRQNLAHVLADGSVDPSWNPGADRIVEDLVVVGSTVYAAGGFTTLGGVPRSRLAAISASGAVTSWNPGADGHVTDLATSGSTIYVGGAFSALGQQSRNSLGAVDLSGDVTAWDPNVNGSVVAMAVTDGIVYAGGHFTTVSGQARSRIAAIDSSGAPTAWNPGADGAVLALAASGSTVYAGGRFTAIGGESRSRLAAIDAQGAPTGWNPGADRPVWDLEVDGSLVYAAGEFSEVSGTTRLRLAGITTGGALTSWDPKSSSPAYALAVSGSTVYVAGGFKSVGGVVRRNAAEIDLTSGHATAWDPNASGSEWTGAVRALLVHDDLVYAGGNFTSIGGQARSRLAALDEAGAATAWHPGASGTVFALARSGSTIYAGGDFHTVQGKIRTGLAAIGLDGTLTAWDPNPNSGVKTLAVSDSRLYAGGSFSAVAGQPRSRLAAFDLSGTLTGWNPAADATVDTLAVAGSTIYAGGGFTSVGGAARNGVAAIDETGTATAWNPNAGNAVKSLAVTGDTVYAGGYFGSIGGQPRDRLAALDPAGLATSWSPSVRTAIWTVAAQGETLYAGGSYDTAGRPFSAYVSSPVSTRSPVLSAQPLAGEPVEVDGSWNNDPASFEYGWRLGGNAVTGAGAKSYTPSVDDIGRELAGQITATNLGGSATAVSAARTVESAPRNTAPPTVSGSAAVGSQLTGLDGDWLSLPAAGVTRQWQRCDASGDACADVAGETGDSYSVTEADVSKTLRFSVTQANVHGSGSARSAPTAEVQAPDRAGPTLSLSHAGGPPQSWVNWYSDDVTVAATDSGSGVAEIQVDTGQGAPKVFRADCSATCPQTLEHLFSLYEGDLVDGVNTVTVSARDGAGNQSAPSTFEVKLDREGPGISVTGALRDAAGQTLSRDSSYGLVVEGIGGTSGETRDGVESIEIYVDGRLADSVTQPCTSGSCSLSHTFTFDPSMHTGGAQTITVYVVDQLGNRSADSWSVVTPPRDDAPPALTLSGSLYSAAGQTLEPQGQYSLEATGRDGSALDPEAGVTELEVLVDGQRKAIQTQQCPEGSCALSVSFAFATADYAAGSHTVLVRARDAAGKETSESFTVLVPSAVVGGRVITHTGERLAGVTVSIADHPEYGQTETGPEGDYYLSVKGAGALRLSFVKDSYRKAEHAAELEWQTYTWTGNVSLDPQDSELTPADFSDPVAPM